MPYCKYCGNVTDSADKHCRACGKDLTAHGNEPPEVYYKKLPQTERVCCGCGKTLPATARFCGECGAENEIINNKQLPYCVLCDELLPESAKYCTLCGVQYIDQEDGFCEIPTQPTCGSCGMVMLPTVTFCTRCGTPAEQKRAARIRKTVPACRFCGTPIHVDGNFCENCGKQISTRRTVTKIQNSKVPSDAYVRPIVLADGRLQCPACGFSNMNSDRIACWECGAKFIARDKP